MLREYRKHDLELAAKVAVLSWRGNEEQICLKIQNASRIGRKLGREWLNYWMLSRTAPLENRDSLYRYMTRARRQLLSPNLTSERAYYLVQNIAETGAQLGGTTGRPLSLVSKLAFSCKPELFSPYDKRARAALKLGGHATNGNYPAFMIAFNNELCPFKGALTEAGISVGSNIFGVPVTMSQTLFEVRTFDKYLMLVGGFSRGKMKEIASGVKQKQHAGRVWGDRKQAKAAGF